jgi:glycosyltransferase involved in cell wall biosynthesis
MATINRSIEVEQFCIGLKNQTYNNYELIIVDQNEGDNVFNIYKKYENFFSIKYIKSTRKGLSYNRNLGLAQMTGNIIAFPDDDCEYKPDTLEFVDKSFADKKLDYFTFNSCDKNDPSLPKYSSNDSHYVNKSNFYSSGISYALFIKSSLIKEFKFDLRLGIGAEFGSGEESDLVLYLIKQKAIGFYDGNYCIFHPYKPLKEGNVERVYSYAKGYGALYRKAFSCYKYYPLIFSYLLAVMKNVFGVFATNKQKYHGYALKGKLIGFIKYKAEKS